MKKICLLFIAGCLFTNSCFSQITVTNYTNTTPNLAATYTSLENAITALNTITAISGPVTITLAAGNPQTAPAGGGYAIQFAPATSIVNNIIIDGTNNIITASPALTVGFTGDAIFKLIGTDFVTIQNFNMQENPANNITAPQASNNMTEFGVALLRGTPTNGAQNNTILNNTITLNKTYQDSYGIYSNVRSAAATVTIVNDITSVGGANSGNKIYGNSISNVNFGITFIGTALAGAQDVGNDIGGTSAATGNTISNWGGLAPLAVYPSNSPTSYCIYVNNQTSENVSYNTITSAAISGTPVTFVGIRKDYTASQPVGTLTTTISNNTISMTSGLASGVFTCILSQGMNPLSTAIINITNNALLNCAITGAGSSSSFVGINNNSSPGTLNINGNIIKGVTTTATTGSFTGIYNIGSPVNSINIINNQIGNATGNAVTFSVATSGNITGIQNVAAGSAAVVNITNNTFDRINAVACNGTTHIISQQGAAATININNNALGTTTGNLITYSSLGGGNINGILNSGGGAATTLNINYNTIDGVSVVACGSFLPIRNLANVGVAVNINNNSMGTATGAFITTSGAQSNLIYGIFNAGGLSTTAVSIQFNDIRGIVHSVLSSCSHQYITNTVAVALNTISNNSFTNLSVNTTGDVTMITKSGAMIAGAASAISNNSVVTAFNKTRGGGTVYMYYSNAASVGGTAVTITGNNFSNVTVTGNTAIRVFNHEEGASTTSAPSCDISGNTINNVIYQTGQFNGFFVDRGLGVNISSNIISNVSGAGDNTPIFYGSSIGTGTLNINSNAISSITSSAGSILGIYGSSPYVTVSNIYNNILMGFSSGGFNGMSAINAASGTVLNIYDNEISNLSTSNSGLPSLNGIWLGANTTTNVYNNKIYNLLSTGAVGSTAPPVAGITLTGGSTATIYNNFVADLKATNANVNDAICGINITSTVTNSVYNLYYNSIYINAASAGTNFGTSGIYHTASATASTAALNMIDNIVVNTSTPRGSGRIAAYRRSSIALNNFIAGSDYNLFYAGTPSATRLIFYDGTNSDQTLTAYQARVITRDANSISTMPNFVSVTDLHLTAANCRIDGRGTPIGTVTNDIDLAARNATTPDIGADEFTATTSTTLAGVAATPVCEDRTIALTGTTYTNNACELIARVLPSGADPVAGKVNVCVTLDATQQTFNGEPYVQRHFDVEPVTSNQSSTSATITLYFTDAEFALYNSNNPVQPPLPTNGPGNTIANRNNLKVTQFHGVGTGSPTSPGNYPGVRILITPGATNVFWNGTYWEVTFNVAGFSGFYLHTNNYNAPLPITVNYLTGRKQGSNHLLNWKVTCATSPRATMALERSADGRNYMGINTITADAARCNQPFDYTDANPLKGMNYYRLKIVDADGKITYSTTVALLNAAKGFDIISIAPNPVVNDNFKLNVASALSGKMEIVIFDMQGRLVNRQSFSIIAGFNSLPVNVANLPAGTYTIKAGMAGEQTKIIRFVKQ